MSRPDRIEVTSRPAIIGNRCTPDSVGEIPWTTWRKIGRKVSAPNIAKPRTNPIARSGGRRTARPPAVRRRWPRRTRPRRRLVPAPLARRHHIADDRLGEDHQTAAAHPLQTAKADQRAHAPGDPAQRRSGEEDHDGAHEERFAPVLVTQLAPQWSRRGGGEHVRGDGP